MSDETRRLNATCMDLCEYINSGNMHVDLNMEGMRSPQIVKCISLIDGVIRVVAAG